jgi:hypothetical protein
MAPSIGRIVWYQAHGSPNGQHKSEPRAAIVTEVVTETVIGLCVLNPSGLFFNQGCNYDEAGGPGTWRWPAKLRE